MTVDAPRLQSAGGSSYRLPKRIFIGAVVSPQTLLSIRIIKRGVLGVGTSGVIRFVEDLDELDGGHSNGEEDLVGQEDERCATPVPITPSNGHPSPTTPFGFLSEQHKAEEKLIQTAIAKHGWIIGDCEIIRLSPESFLCPGFIDTHTHAPQVPNLGRGQQYELLDWLQYVTFPRERKFEDTTYARKTYESVVDRMLNAGTTCAAIYATLHEEATCILADICNEKGMRALIGKCQMDRNSPVDYIEKNPSASMEATKNFIHYCRNLAPYGTAKPDDVNGHSSLRSEESESPEMESSIVRLKATMNEMLLGGKGEKKEKDEAADPSSLAATSKTTTTGGTDSLTTSTVPPTKSGHTNKRQASISSTTSSTSRGSESPRKQHSNDLVQPILTPRFAISCSDALLTSISALMSRDPTLRIQTHLSENEGEIAFTKELFPFTSSYTDVYDHFSLLTPRTILAHAIHLDEQEMELLCKRKCGISHCPTSNNNLRSGVSRVGEMLNRGLKVGLGTDISGGFGLSILTAIREASVVAKVLGFSSHGHKEPLLADAAAAAAADRSTSMSASAPKKEEDGKYRTSAVGKVQPRELEASGSRLNMERSKVASFDFCKGPLSVATLFYLATLGGAEVCNLANRVGSLEVGKEFDALLINTANGCPNLYIEDDDSIEERLEKMLFCGDDRNIASVFVRGRVVGGSSPIA
ncbi:hypothetical protein CBS101457_002817 [Exobasidium rhododendri]|nr:hypothetical protein CBS101457_002817 [Exobasidium rhododendri]